MVPAVEPILYRVLGEARATYLAHRFDDLIESMRYGANPQGSDSQRRLNHLRDTHRGERCFIIGNGPSLKEMDLSPLRDEFTFGLNRAYLMFDKLGFATDCLVSVNRHVIEQCAEEISAQPCLKFISWANRNLLPANADVAYVRSVQQPGFSTNPATRGVWEGATVTFVAMQLAYLMGFEQVYLVGVDHSFSTTGEPHKLVQSQGDDPNHFDASYFGKGFLWQLPDLETSEVAYSMARRAFEEDNRQILDATVDGKLQIFEKVSFDNLFKKSGSNLASLAADR